MTHIDDVKKDVHKSISYARKVAKDMIKKDIDCSDMNQFVSVLSARDEARSMALVLTRLFPGDADIEYIWKEAIDAYNLGYKAKDRFMVQCKCKNR